tara:strand:+ start:16218 stop:16412 length:195 start_codon:yes stop_codon:yes gene_type:complete
MSGEKCGCPDCVVFNAVLGLLEEGIAVDDVIDVMMQGLKALTEMSGTISITEVTAPLDSDGTIH